MADSAARAGFTLVTPASRGLGFAFAKQLLSRTDLPVVATARNDCPALRQRLLDGATESRDADKRLTVLEVDVTQESTISSMASRIREVHPKTPLRLALTVPGILHVEKSPAQVEYAAALDSFKVNALAPLMLIKHLSPFLPSGADSPFSVSKAVSSQDPLKLPSHAIYAMMAARVGSISDNSTGGWYSYRSSKAAVFQLAKTYDLHLRTQSGDKALAVALHPGTVHTEFTKEFWGSRDMLEPDDSARKLLQVLVGMGSSVNDGRGRCWDWKGEEVLP